MTHEYYYEADGGEIMIGNQYFRANYPNCYGDGCFKVIVTDNNDLSDHNYRFVGSIDGNFNVYEYDCLHNGFDDKANILCTLNGRYGVFAKNGNVKLVKWN